MDSHARECMRASTLRMLFAPLFFRRLTRQTAPVRSEPIPCNGRPCLRRMARARLLRVLPSDIGSQRLAKDHRDRCIGGRGRQNEKERLIHRACCRMLRDCNEFLLKIGYSLRLNVRDSRDCFYLSQVDKRLSRDRSSGLGCSECWFSDLEDTSQGFFCRSAPSDFGSAVT